MKAMTVKWVICRPPLKQTLQCGTGYSSLYRPMPHLTEWGRVLSESHGSGNSNKSH